MRHFLVLLLLALPITANANFLFQYGLNYSSGEDSSADGDSEQSRTFHKALLAGSINRNKTLFLGWNINSWSSSLKQGDGDEDTYSMLEMGPRLQWYTNDNYNLYFSAEWNPYARGEREKVGTKRDISGSSLGVGIGYRFRISRMMGVGASLHYHSLSISEEKVNNNEDDVSDKVTNFMPMLEFTILTR